MRAPGTRLLLTSIAASAVVAGAALFAAGALALRAAGRATPGTLAAVGAAAVLLATWAAAAMLVRRVARPVERVLAAADTVQRRGPGDLPVVADGGLGLDRAALAFERTAAALLEERGRLAAKVEELTAANRSLAEARESLLRSEKLATVGRLAAGVAHEVGNPLGAITGYADLARSRLPAGADPLLVDALDRIASAAGRIDHTVRGLLDFARPGPAELGPVPVAPAVEAALDLARMQARFRGVEVATRMADALPPVVGRDRELCQALLNLLLNAADAMQGQGRIEVAARRDGDRVELTLSDRGPGIDPADRGRIFDPFFTTKPPGAGTGLGLAITHSIVGSFGGTIEAMNAPGGGAVFRIELRVAEPGAGRPG